MRRALLCLLPALALAACVFKPEIRQGNFLSDDLIAQVKPGMTQGQVEFVLGRPMLKDPFHPDRWDYIRYFNPNDGYPVQQRHVVVYFKDGKVDRLEQPVDGNTNNEVVKDVKIEDLKTGDEPSQGTPP